MGPQIQRENATYFLQAKAPFLGDRSRCRHRLPLRGSTHRQLKVQ